MKKLLTGFLCICMAASLLIPTLAAEENNLEDSAESAVESLVEDVDEGDAESLYEDVGESGAESLDEDVDDSDAESLIIDSNENLVDYPSQVFNIIVPSSMSFVIDPFELAGRGQIYSEGFPIINCGETDVLLMIANIKAIFANDTDFEPLAEPYRNESLHAEKSVYLVLDFGRDDTPPIVLTDSDADSSVYTILYAGQTDSACTLSVNGSVNPSPAEDWQAGDIKIQLTYLLEILFDESTSEEAASPEDTDEEEDSDNQEDAAESDETNDTDETGEPEKSDEPEYPEESAVTEDAVDSEETKEPEEPYETDEEGKPPDEGADLEPDAPLTNEDETEAPVDDYSDME